MALLAAPPYVGHLDITASSLSPKGDQYRQVVLYCVYAQIIGVTMLYAYSLHGEALRMSERDHVAKLKPCTAALN